MKMPQLCIGTLSLKFIMIIKEKKERRERKKKKKDNDVLIDGIYFIKDDTLDYLFIISYYVKDAIAWPAS